jgi:hypothetical protein
MTMASALRLVEAYDPVRDISYKSDDQIAFEKALETDTPHSFIAAQGLGFFNAVDLHEATILRDAGSKSFLVSNPHTAKALERHVTDRADIEQTLASGNTAFYAGLSQAAAKAGDSLRTHYKLAMRTTAFGRILHDELRTDGIKIKRPQDVKITGSRGYIAMNGAKGPSVRFCG